MKVDSMNESVLPWAVLIAERQLPVGDFSTPFHRLHENMRFMPACTSARNDGEAQMTQLQVP